MENKEQLEAVKNCKNFTELYTVIAKMSPFISYNRPQRVEWNFEQILERIELVREHGYPLNYVTRAGGLRDKVKELLEL